MVLKKIKPVFILSMSLAIFACNSQVITNTNNYSRESFSDLDKEYDSLKMGPVSEFRNYFKTEALTLSYFKRKIDKWLTEPINGHALVKELLYAKSKHPQLYYDLLLEDDLIYDKINAVQEVIDRKEIDPAFAAFLMNSHSPTESGNEFLVNTTILGTQKNPNVAMNDTGDFVITWIGVQDGYDIYAQRYNAVGEPQGSELHVNTNGFGYQINPSIAMDNDGDFTITWRGATQYDGGNEIFAQQFEADGTFSGSEFRVNTYTNFNQEFPTIAMDDTGNFIITWSSLTKDGDGFGISAQRYNSAGVPQGSEFRVNTYTTHNQISSAVAMDNTGDFVITWQSNYKENSYSGISAQRYNSAGEPQGSEFHVNTYTSGYQFFPNIAMDVQGNFVITWSSWGQDGAGYGVYAQKFSSDGTFAGSEFRVNTFTAGAENGSRIAMDNDGDFIITWENDYQPPDNYFGIFAQRYNSSGSAVGSEFLVNYNTEGGQWASANAMDSDGDFVVSWTSNGGTVGDDYGVFAKRYNSAGVPQ
jgi:hypothetical protein